MIKSFLNCVRLNQSKIKIVLFTILILLIFLFNIPIPINRTINALEISLIDETHVKDRVVTIQGHYHFNLFVRHHRFTGSIKIEEYPETHYEMIPLYLTQNRDIFNGFRWDTLTYHCYASRIFAMIYTRPLFVNTVIVLNNDHMIMDLMTSPLIILNANTREKALQYLNEIINVNTFNNGSS